MLITLFERCLREPGTQGLPVKGKEDDVLQSQEEESSVKNEKTANASIVNSATLELRGDNSDESATIGTRM